MNSEKTRDRTLEELSDRKIEFLKICDVLDKHKVNYFLIGGILLGAIRDKDFVKWDWGIDIGVFSEDFLDSIELVANSLKEREFEIIRINKNQKDLKIYFKGKQPEAVTGYGILGWEYDKKKSVYSRTQYSIPSKFLTNFSKLVFFGREFQCPNNPEEYLSYAYGNWKVPLRSSDKNFYNSDNYYKVSFLRNLKNLIKKYLQRN